MVRVTLRVSASEEPSVHDVDANRVIMHADSHDAHNHGGNHVLVFDDMFPETSTAEEVHNCALRAHLLQLLDGSSASTLMVAAFGPVCRRR